MPSYDRRGTTDIAGGLITTLAGLYSYRSNGFNRTFQGLLRGPNHLGDDAGNRGSTVARFAAGLAPHGAATVLAGRDGSATGTAAVAVTRSDAALSSAVTTVDDVNAESGRITSVLALADLVRGGKPGQFGIGQGASSVTVPQ